MKPITANAITDVYIVTSMSMGWDDDGSTAAPSIFTTMSIEYMRKPASCTSNGAADAGGNTVPPQP